MDKTAEFLRRAGASGCRVASRQERFERWHLVHARQADLEVTRAEVADLADVPGEAWLQIHRRGIHLQVDQQVLRLRVNFDAREVLDAAEREVLLRLLLRHVVTQPEDEGLDSRVQIL